MATTVGIYISLDNDTDTGLRPDGWCSQTNHPLFWTNQSIRFSGTLDSADARVGDHVTIEVEVRATEWTIDGTGVPGQEDTLNQVNGVQAWVCYPTSSYEFVLVPSMDPAHGGTPPTYTGPPVQLSGNYPDANQAWQNAAKWFSLTPTWTPKSEDLVAPNTTTHACVLANCWGIANVDIDEPELAGGEPQPVGQEVTVLSQIDVCASAGSDQDQPLYRQGQRNIHIVPIPAHHGKRTGTLGFLAGTPRAAEPSRVVVDVKEIQQDVVDPTVLSVLRYGEYHALKLRPATTPAATMVIRTNPYEQPAPLATILHEAEETVPDGTGLRLVFPPGGLQPLLLEVELDASEAPGSVHVFDIVQTDSTMGTISGSRVATVTIP